MKRAFLAAFLLFPFFASPVFAQTRSTIPWDSPKKVDEKTVLFGEKGSSSGMAEADDSEPKPGDKSYAWRLLERGNNFFLAGHMEKAAAAFSKCYGIEGPTRVLSGFKLIEAYEKLGRVDEAIAVLEEMKQKYLVSTKEFGEAVRIRAGLEDAKRRSVIENKLVQLTGHEWLLMLQPARMKYVLGAMEVLRTHGIPLKEPAHSYAFLLDEYFIAHSDSSADDAPAVLAVVIYERDSEARLPIDRWRRDPSWLPPAEKKAASEPEERLTGAEWVLLTHADKLSYVLGAMEILKAQNVPMQKSPYAYEYAVDQLFTDKPELSASDSVVTLASILYDSEPEAREVLEAIRLK